MSTCGELTLAAICDSFDPVTRWSTSTPSRRPGCGPNSPTIAGRSSIPPRYSTTTPTSRRSSPQMRSTSSASCRPFHVDPAGLSHLGPARGRGDRPGRGPGRLAGRTTRLDRLDQDHGLAFEQERRRTPREHPALAVPVLQRDRVFLPAAPPPRKTRRPSPPLPAPAQPGPSATRAAGLASARIGHRARTARCSPGTSVQPFRKSAGQDLGVVAEVHLSRAQATDPLERVAPGNRIGRLPGRQVLIGRPAVLRRRVHRIADQHVESYRQRSAPAPTDARRCDRAW